MAASATQKQLRAEIAALRARLLESERMSEERLSSLQDRYEDLHHRYDMLMARCAEIL